MMPRRRPRTEGDRGKAPAALGFRFGVRSGGRRLKGKVVALRWEVQKGKGKVLAALGFRLGS